MQSQKSILIVEDQADLRKLVSLTLRPAGYRLREAVDGATALRECAEERPDLVILDLMLPGNLDGVAVCRRIKSDPELAAAIVIMMTAADQARERERARAAGADHYVAKPFSPGQLRVLVQTLLD
jgi:DNA-binding response OmpR family regulator